MTKTSRLALALGGVALPMLLSLPALAQQPPAPAPAPPAQAPQSQAPQPRGPQVSAADRAAFRDARIAAVHAGLQLTPDQERLWPALERAVRDGMTQLASLREQRRTAERPKDMVEAMGRRADADLARGTAMKAIADAARPLYATLTEEQKRRLPMLMHAGRDRMHERFAARGEHQGHHHRMRRDDDRGPGMMRRGDRDEDGRMGMRRGDRDDGPRSRWGNRDGFDRWN